MSEVPLYRFKKGSALTRGRYQQNISFLFFLSNFKSHHVATQNRKSKLLGCQAAATLRFYVKSLYFSLQRVVNLRIGCTRVGHSLIRNCPLP